MKKLFCLFLLVVGLMSTGCVGSFEETRGEMRLRPAAEDRTYCQQLDADRAFYGGVALGAMSVSGAQGIGAILLPKDMKHRDEWKTGLEIGATVATAVGTTAYFIYNAKNTAWVRDCSE